MLALAGLTLGQPATAQDTQQNARQQNESRNDSSADQGQQSNHSASFEFGNTGMTLRETDEGIRVTEVQAGSR